MFHPFLALIASATARELAKYVEYLNQENLILREADIVVRDHDLLQKRQVCQSELYRAANYSSYYPRNPMICGRWT